MRTNAARHLPRPVALIGLGFATFWLTILAHEAAHFVTGMAMVGNLHFSWFQPLPAHDRIPIVAAGPLMTLLILVTCAVVAIRRGHASLLLVGCVIGAASRILLIARTTLLASGDNDEVTFARLTGISAAEIWLAETMMALACVRFVLARTPSENRGRPTAWIAVGVVAGWISAVTFGRAVGLPI
jgi:hypothetical protein